MGWSGVHVSLTPAKRARAMFVGRLAEWVEATDPATRGQLSLHLGTQQGMIDHQQTQKGQRADR
jgi:hypothetical protein